MKISAINTIAALTFSRGLFSANNDNGGIVPPWLRSIDDIYLPVEPSEPIVIQPWPNKR